jgi:hypothetical protein
MRQRIKHQLGSGVVSVTPGDLLLRKIELFYDVDEKAQHGSHEHAEVVHVIDNVRILLDDVSERF